MTKFSAPLKRWRHCLTDGAGEEIRAQLARFYGADEIEGWCRHYDRALAEYADAYGDDAEVVISRCPAQMNIMGMHIDYGGMPSLRLAVKGADTITVAGRCPTARGSRRVRMKSILRSPMDSATEPGAGERGDSDFDSLDFDLGDLLPDEDVGNRQALMDYAGRVCSERERTTGSAVDDHWGILPKGQLIFLESYFRGRCEVGGVDALVCSNVSPSGGMSSSSALVISTAYAALGIHGLSPGVDMCEEDLIDGIGTSEWIRGTRGGTADHGGMILGRMGELVSVGVFPARPMGRAALPPDYAAVIIDSGVPRVYDDAVKEETVIAYPLGTFMVRDLLLPDREAARGWRGLVGDYAQRIEFIRDISADNLGLEVAQIYQLLLGIPESTTLSEIEALARAGGAGQAFESMHRRDIGDKFPHIGPEHPVRLRRRFAFGLAEQDRVRAMVGYMNAGDMGTALELVRISHAGDRENEVADEDLLHRLAKAEGGDRADLCFLPGGYGRMTPAYDRVATTINDFLLDSGGRTAGAVQRLGAGWGGNVGGLVRKEYVSGPRRRDFEELLQRDLNIDCDLANCIASPGEGACLLTPPAEG